VKKVLIIAILIILFLIFGIVPDLNDHEYIITVTGKERIIDDESSKYLIFGDTDEGESLVFENTDTLIRGKFNSSDFQGKMKIGQRYKVTVVGFREPFFSWYENIIDVQELENNDSIK